MTTGVLTNNGPKVLYFKTREGSGTRLQYSCLETPVDGGAWWATVHGVTKSWTRLSDFTSTFHFPALEKEMATHSSVLAWRIPGTGEPGGLPSMGSHRVRHDWGDLAVAAVLILCTLFWLGFLLLLLFKLNVTEKILFWRNGSWGGRCRGRRAKGGKG